MEEKRGPPLPAALHKLYLVTSNCDEAVGKKQDERGLGWKRESSGEVGTGRTRESGRGKPRGEV